MLLLALRAVLEVELLEACLSAILVVELVRERLEPLERPARD